MTKLALTNEAIDLCFGGLLSKLDDASKRRLINRITESMRPPETGTCATDFLEQFGTWEDSRSTEEIIRDIRESRVGYRLPDQ
jgi:hypothetical protein